MRPANREQLRANGTVLYLHAEPQVLFERVGHSRNRPMLKAADPLARLTELYVQRDPLYREVADHVVRYAVSLVHATRPQPRSSRASSGLATPRMPRSGASR